MFGWQSWDTAGTDTKDPKGGLVEPAPSDLSFAAALLREANRCFVAFAFFFFFASSALWHWIFFFTFLAGLFLHFFLKTFHYAFFASDSPQFLPFFLFQCPDCSLPDLFHLFFWVFLCDLFKFFHVRPQGIPDGKGGATISKGITNDELGQGKPRKGSEARFFSPLRGRDFFYG